MTDPRARKHWCTYACPDCGEAVSGNAVAHAPWCPAAAEGHPFHVEELRVIADPKAREEPTP